MTHEAYSTLTKALSESEAGRSLLGTYRWSNGGFRDGQTNEEWEKIFGVTAVDFKHGILMHNIGNVFLKYEEDRFTPHQKFIFPYGLFGHDFGEAHINGKGIGDISVQDKTAKDEKIESRIARMVINSLDISDELKSNLLKGYKEVVEGGDPILFDAFKALEKTEYVISVMKVFQNCKRLRLIGQTAMKHDKEMPLVGRVLTIDLTKILDVYTPKYPKSIGHLFRNSQGLIDEMFDYSLPWLLSHDSWREKPWDHKALAESFRVKWEAFKKS